MTEAPAALPRDLRIVELAAPGGALVARFAAGAGMVGCSLRHHGEELLGLGGGLDAYLGEGAVFGLPLLHPWANRLAGWSYAAAGREVVLDRGSPLLHGEEHCLPIHGALAAGSDWKVTRHEAAALRAELDWGAHPDLLTVFPFAHRLALDIAVEDDAVQVLATVRAGPDAPVPLAFGFHPYLAPPGAPREAWEVELPARTELCLDDRGLPDGAVVERPRERLTLGTRTFDDLFALPVDGARFSVSGGGRRVAVEFGPGYPYAQVFAPAEQPVICFEPMTAPTNALRSHDGLRLVPAGAAATAAFALRVEPA
ncbi:MAG TPA: aldose 1-epimerase [Solirubrobacteraceae bacterium]|nr:aldose 1-epimerase [Solirubrobacteraceae bacterium]